MRKRAEPKKERLATLRFVKEEDLPPMVQLTFEMSDKDGAFLAAKAKEMLTRKEQDEILSSELIRRSLVELAVEAESEEGYICHDCAIKLKGKWPKGHVATMHSGVCPQCLHQESLAAVDDYDWPRGSKRPKGYGGGRD